METLLYESGLSESGSREGSRRETVGELYDHPVQVERE